LLLAGTTAAMIVDAPILRWRSRKGAWEFPSGALLTGALVAMVLSPAEPWWVAAVTSVMAVVSKYVCRLDTANVFNPAALALVATFYVFNTAQDWWGAMTDASPYAMVVLVATGVFITSRVNKLPMVLAFLGVYYALFSSVAFAADPKTVAEIFRTPDLQMALFFAFFILTDPPTSPTRYPHQVMCGVLVAVVSFAIFEWLGAAWYLLGGVLAGNVWESGRRWLAQRARTPSSRRDSLPVT
jgi:Na+-translocating ferredoxin:NAD+ oxidoreductase RnfD subunit